MRSHSTVVLLLVACTGSEPTLDPVTSSETSPLVTPASCNVATYGAIPNDALDDREWIQAAIDDCATTGGRDVYVGPGLYLIGKSPAGFFGLDLKPGTRLRGAGRSASILRQTAGIGPSVNLARALGDDITVESLTLDGDKTNQTVNEHRHGILIQNGRRFTAHDVASQNFTGDGFYLYIDSADVTLEHVYATDNDRNGVTLGGTSTNVSILGSYFLANAAQQVDSEPGAPHVVSHIKIAGSTLDARGRNNGYVLTISGTGRDTPPGHDWTVVGNTINGPILTVWVEGVTVTGNSGVNPTTKPCFTAARRSRNVVYSSNRCTMTQTTQSNVAAIYVYGTSVNDTPARVSIVGNTVDLSGAHADSHGVSATGVSSIQVVNNTLRGPGQPSAISASGVYLRAALVDEDYRSAKVAGNYIANFGKYGVFVMGNGAARMLALDVSGNTFDDDSAVPTMTVGASLTAGGLPVIAHWRAGGNLAVGGVAVTVTNQPPTPEG